MDWRKWDTLPDVSDVAVYDDGFVANGEDSLAEACRKVRIEARHELPCDVNSVEEAAAICVRLTYKAFPGDVTSGHLL